MSKDNLSSNGESLINESLQKAFSDGSLKKAFSDAFTKRVNEDIDKVTDTGISKGGLWLINRT